jgi:hypothetical protein
MSTKTINILDAEKIPHAEILKKFRQALLACFPNQVQQLILFGSQARGEATLESDIDVLVVVNWEEEPLADGFYAAPFSDPRWQKIVEVAYDISLEYGVVLAPFVISEKRFQQWSPLSEQVKQEGIQVWKKN